MTRSMLTLTLAALATSTPALAGDAEITLKFATIASMATALDEADPEGGWLAVDADPEPLAAKTKADILIESMGNATDPLVVGYDPALLRDVPWGVTTDGLYTLYAVGDITLKRGVFGGFVEGSRASEAADIAAPRDLTWTDAAFDSPGYLAIGVDGSAQLVFPPVVSGLVGVEPDEID